jgi:ABC-2 type transport system ATP-binding protein
MASIYRSDAGSVRMAGRVAPFIELGVGFDMELSARENIVLNAVMMGLTPQEARRRVDAALEFAELEEFVDLKLKNYSSGMLVRLAFSLMMEVDADILLIDEVLAVGDAAFQQKCGDAFREMKAAGKTIVLVTHEMSTVEDFCHRAMLIDGGLIQQIGDPAEIGRSYLRMNFDRESAARTGDDSAASDEVRLIDAWVEAADGSRPTSLEHGDEIRLRVELEAKRDAAGFDFGFILANADGVGVFEFGAPVENPDGSRPIAGGKRFRVDAELQNPLAPGRYFVHCGVNRIHGGGVALYVHNAISFVVFGGPQARGVVLLPLEISAKVESEATK